MDKGESENAQAIILSVILTCVLLLTVMYYVTSSVNAASMATRAEGMSRAEVDNVLWAQEQGLKACATKSSGIYAWYQRAQAVERFKWLAGAISGNISKSLLEQGISYGIAFNDTLAKAAIKDGTMESVDGVILKNAGGVAMIAGYACDVELYDGKAKYRISKPVFIG